MDTVAIIRIDAVIDVFQNEDHALRQFIRSRNHRMKSTGLLVQIAVVFDFKTAYNPNLGAAMSLILMVLIFVCVSIMNHFGENEDEEVMAKV